MIPDNLEFNQLELTKSEVIYDVSWEIYESLIEKYWGENSPRLTYDSGILEVEMANSLKHEEEKKRIKPNNNRNLAALFEQIALELEMDFRRCGSTTFKRRTIGKGFEPDSCYFIHSLQEIAGKSDLNFEKNPPPDLIIEINRTSSSVPRMPVFAAFGVKEVWRFDGKNLRFYVLEEGVYLETAMSIELPILSNEKAFEFLRDSQKLGNVTWAKKIKNWVSKVK